MGRRLVAVAHLHGRVMAGEEVHDAEIERLLRQVLALYERRNDQEWVGYAGIGSVGAFLQGQLIDLASARSAACLMRVWTVFHERWNERPSLLLAEGLGVLPSFSEAGLRAEAREQLLQLEALQEKTGQAESETWLDLATAWLNLDRPDEVERLLRRASAASSRLVTERTTSSPNGSVFLSRCWFKKTAGI